MQVKKKEIRKICRALDASEEERNEGIDYNTRCNCVCVSVIVVMGDRRSTKGFGDIPDVTVYV